MFGRPTNESAQLEFTWTTVPAHSIKRLMYGLCGPKRQPRNDRSSGGNAWIGGKHYAGHRAACREASNIYASPVDTMLRNHLLDHLIDRQGFTAAAPCVIGLKPVETQVGVVGALLLRVQQCEPLLIGQSQTSPNRDRMRLRFADIRATPPREERSLRCSPGI